MGLYQDKKKMFGGNGMAVDRSAELLPVTREVQKKTEQKKAQEKKNAPKAAQKAAQGAKNDRKGFEQLEAPAKQDQLKSEKQENTRPRFESKFRKNWLEQTADPLGVAGNGGRIRFTPRNPTADGKKDRPVFTPSTISETKEQGDRPVFVPSNVLEMQASKAPSIHGDYNPFGAYRVTSAVGPRNTGISGASRNHKGTDYAMPVGTQIPSPVSGEVIETGYNNARGYYVRVRDGQGNIHTVQHLSKILTKKGQKVNASDVIAASGNSGVGSGPHLHYEITGSDGSTKNAQTFFQNRNSVELPILNGISSGNENGNEPKYKTVKRFESTISPRGIVPQKTEPIFGNQNFKRFESKVLDNANMQYPLITPKVKPQKMSSEEYLRRYIEKGRHSENNPLVTGGLHVSEFQEENKWYMDNLSDEEKAQINFLYGRYDKKEADKRARAVWAKKKEDFQDFIAQEGGAAGFMAKNRAVVKSVGAGMQYGVEKLGQNMKHKLFGIDEPIPEYSAGSLSIKSGERARNTFTKGDGGFVKTAKEIGLSVWDNASRVAMYGGAAPFVMALDVFGHATKDADERGATINQSMIYGLANGAAEFLGEKFSLKGLENIAKAGGTGIKNIIKSVGAQVAKEAGEEAATEVMNIISDAVIMSKNAGTGSQSNFDLYLQSYMENNPDKNKAAAVLGYAKESLIQIGMAGLAGGISGGILSGGARMIGNMRANSYIQDIQNDIDNAKNVIQENNSRIGSVQRDNSLDFSARNKRVSDLITANRAIQDYIQDQETTIQNVKQGTVQESRQKPVTHIDLVSAILREDSGKDGAARAYVNLQGMEDGNYRVTDVYGLETVKSAEVVNARYLPIDTTPAEDGIRYSIKDVGGRAVVVVDTDQGLFAGADPKEYNKIARGIIQEKYVGKKLPLSEYNMTKITEKGYKKYTNPKQDVEPDIFRAKMKASPELENLLKVSQYMGHAEDTKNHPFATQGWDYYKTRFIVDGVEFEGTVNIGLSDKGAYFYDINNIQRTGNLDIKNGTAEQNHQPPGVWPAASDNFEAQGGSSNTTIAQKNHDVNRYSMQNGEENARPVFRPGLGLESRERPVFTYEGSMKLLQDFSEKTGVKVILDRNLAKTEEGWYDSTNRELHINPNQAGRMNTLIKHEFTHVLENSAYYTDLVNYAQRNLQEEWEAAQSFVRGIYAAENQRRTVSGETAIELTPARLSSETMAKLAEQFQTEEFIRDTCRKDPNMAQRFIRIIRDLIERIKEIFGKGYAKPWETAQRKWEKAFSDVVENGVEPYETGQDSGRFAILDNAKGKYVQADRQVITGDNPTQWAKSVEQYINSKIRNGKDIVLTAVDGDLLTITRDTAGKAKFRNDVLRGDGTKTKMSDQEYRAKLDAESHIDELAQASTRGNKTVPDYKNHKFAKDGFNYRTAYFEDFDGTYYRITLSVGKNGEIHTVYNVGRMDKKTNPLKPAQRPNDGKTADRGLANHSVSRNVDTVNGKIKEAQLPRGSMAKRNDSAIGTIAPFDTTIAQTKSDVNSYDMSTNKKYSFAGINAETADLAQLAKATPTQVRTERKTLAKSGAEKKNIYSYVKDIDNSDHWMQIKSRTNPDGSKQYKLDWKRPDANAIEDTEEYQHILEKLGNSKDIRPDRYRTNDIWRIFRDLFGEDYPIAKELFLDPLDDSKRAYKYIEEFYTNILKENVVDKLGIKKGSKLSAYVQKYGEGVLTEAEKEKLSDADMKKIQQADGVFRWMYDSLLDTINDTRRIIYPNAEKRAAEVKTAINNVEHQLELMNLAAMTGDYFDVDGTIESRRKITRLNMGIESKKRLKALKTELEENRQIIPKRKDYYRHFQEMGSSFQEIYGNLTQNNALPNKIAGISEWTKPKSKWMSAAQKRVLEDNTKYDAVGGFLDYLKSAAYAAAIDPNISIFRQLRNDAGNITGVKLDDESYGGKIGGFLKFLDDYANTLAGKTNPLDRWVRDTNPAVFDAINSVASRIKSNAVLGNVSSALAQGLNIPNAIGYIADPRATVPAIGDLVAGIMEDSKTRSLYAKSSFLQERLNDVYSQFDTKIIEQPKKLATWMLGALDDVGTRYIWLSAYRKAELDKDKNPVRYADDVARRMVAGRGIGEIPIWQNSKIVGMAMPFTLEVGNAWRVQSDIIREAAAKIDKAAKNGREQDGERPRFISRVGKQATSVIRGVGRLLLLYGASYLANRILEMVRGTDGGLFDPIEDIIGAESTGKIPGRLAGDLLGSIPVGQALAGIYPENGIEIPFTDQKLPARKDLLGDNDPTRYGTGNLFSGGITKPLTALVPPWGGAQLDKTIKGTRGILQGGVYTKNGELKYPVERDPVNATKGILFGRSGFRENSEYYDQEGKPLSEKQTEKFKNSEDGHAYWREKLKQRGRGKITLSGKSYSVPQEVEDEYKKLIEDKKESNRNLLETENLTPREMTGKELSHTQKLKVDGLSQETIELLINRYQDQAYDSYYDEGYGPQEIQRMIDRDIELFKNGQNFLTNKYDISDTPYSELEYDEKETLLKTVDRISKELCDKKFREKIDGSWEIITED